MKKLLTSILYWTYERGSWQWDLSCLTFILIIFTTPPEVFERFTRNPLTPDQIRQIVLSFF